MEEDLVRLLEQRPIPDNQWRPQALEAARLLCLSADLTPWEGRLADLFRDFQDIELLQAVADALAAHYLLQGRLGDLETLLDRTRYADYLLRGFESVDQPGPALGLVARHSPRIMAELLSKRPDLLRAGLDAAFRDAPDRLPAILQDLALWRRMPLQGALDLMLQLLDRGTPESRRTTAHAFRLAAEAGADVSAVRAPLQAQPDPETRSNLAYALALSACRSKDWAQLDEVLFSEPLREGALKALYVAWVEKGMDEPEIASRVVRSLPESEKLLMEARRRKRQAQPTEADVLGLREPSAGLYWLVVDRPDRARQLAPSFTGAARRTLDEIAAGTHRKACWTCRNVPRHTSASSDSDLPVEFRSFGIDPKTESAELKCAECGAPYRYSYSCETEDMSYWETFELDRLRPAPDRSLLEHMDPNLRREAAWALAAEGGPEVLVELLRSEHPEVRQEALLALKPDLDPGVVEQLLSMVDDGLAVQRLTRHLNKQGDWTALAGLLPRLEPALQGTLLVELEHAPASLVAEPSLRLLGSPNRDVGRQAARALLALEELPAGTLERIDELWNEAACGLWADLAQKGAPVEGMLGRAAERLQDGSCCYRVLQGLQTLGRRNFDLHPAMGALAKLMSGPSCPFQNDTMRAVSFGLSAGTPCPEVIAALGHMSARSDASHAVSGMLAAASKNGHDMEPARAALGSLMRNEGGWEREMGAQAWTYHLLRRGELEEVARLLDYGLNNVPGTVASALRESRFDYAVLEPVLERLAQSSDRYNRDCALRALEPLRRTRGS